MEGHSPLLFSEERYRMKDGSLAQTPKDAFGDVPDAVDEKYATDIMTGLRELNPHGFDSQTEEREKSMREAAAKTPKYKHVAHSGDWSTPRYACGVTYEELRFDEDYQAWLKTLSPMSLDTPRCLDCLKLELKRLGEQFEQQKRLQGFEHPLSGLEMLPPARSEPLAFLDEDLLAADE
jgi:hypothetical protein